MRKGNSSIFILPAVIAVVVAAGLYVANAQAPNANPAAATPAGGAPSNDCNTAQQIPNVPQNLPQGFVPPTEEQNRYSSFFMQLYTWDLAAKQAEATGDSGWADHFRTTLERRSGLTPSEAAQVKQIAFQYLQDEEALQKRFSDAGAKERAAHPNTAPSLSTEPPEITALRKEHSDLLNRAIASLVATLGSRSFSKLDLFTRHIDDQMKANAAQVQAGCSNSGVK